MTIFPNDWPQKVIGSQSYKINVVLKELNWTWQCITLSYRSYHNWGNVFLRLNIFYRIAFNSLPKLFAKKANFFQIFCCEKRWMLKKVLNKLHFWCWKLNYIEMSRLALRMRIIFSSDSQVNKKDCSFRWRMFD